VKSSQALPLAFGAGRIPSKSTKLTAHPVTMPLRFLLLLALVLSAHAAENPEPYRLTLDAPIDRWDEAIPLGNGLMGGLLWGSGNELRLSLDRGDLWDLRPHPGFIQRGFNYRTVIDLASSGQADRLNKEYSRVSDFPTKLPGARLVVTLDPRFRAQSFRLDLRRATATVDFGEQSAECFFSANQPVALMFVPGSAPHLDLIANEAVNKLGYPPATLGRDAHSVWLEQTAAQGFYYAIIAAARPVQRGTLLAIAVTTNHEDPDALALARQRTEQALNQGAAKLRDAHEAWWADFWATSSVSLPDAKIAQQYNLAQYFYGAASRSGAPPMPLQGVWTADEGKIPPWHGDYHNDLNTQLTYWAYLASGHFDEGRSFLELMWSLKARHEEFARSFFGLHQGLIVPGVMALDGSPMGAWFQYSLSPTMGAWVAQAFYLHWRYGMNSVFLSDWAYPYCAGIGEALAGLLTRDPRTGTLTLPLSSSPEIHNNFQSAWLKSPSNFDLSLVRWLFAANAEMAAALGKKIDAARWTGLLAQLPPLAVAGESGPLLVAPGEPLAESHRHHSQLMAIFPLGILNTEGTVGDRRIIRSSFDQVDRLGTKQWTGYSFSWMAAMRARAGLGEEALKFLTTYAESFTLRNGFHCNGEQTRKGLSDFHDRAFTLEGNFAAAQAVHEMLLQSWGGRIRVFPAVPASWRDASFKNLRAEGGFAVSAMRREGRTLKVSVKATVAQELRLKNPFGGRAYKHSLPVQESGDEIRASLLPGQVLELKEAGSPLPASSLARRLK